MTLASPRTRTAAPAAPSHLSNVQILRGVAAVMVLVYHIGNEFGDRGFPGQFPDVGAGSAGVDLFFVVSGFVMVHSTAGAFGAPGAPALFLARRVIRLVPLYWLLTTLFAVQFLWASRASPLPPETWSWFAASYLFLFYPHADGGDFPLHPQGWTLNFEMLFYACFAAVLPLARRRALQVLTVGLIAMAVLGLATALPWPLDRWTNTNILEFVLGLGLAVAEARGWRLPLWAAVALAVGGLATFALTIDSVDVWLPYRGFVWGPPACAVVAAAVLWRPDRRVAPGRIRSALERLGDASYSLYLIHYAFFGALGGTIELFVPVTSLPPKLYGSLCFVGPIALSLVVHRWVELPVTRGLNRSLDLSRRWHALTNRS